MLSRIVFTSRRSKVIAIGTLITIGVILFCAVVFSLSPVKAEMEDESQTALMQPEPPLMPDAQAASTVFLPLVAHESTNHAVAHEEAPLPLVMASSAHRGHSAISPPTVNSHTFVADEGGYLDGYWERSQLPNGLLTFVITVTAPVVPANAEYTFADGSLTDAGLEYMISRHKLSQFSSLQLHVWDVDDDAPDCPELDGLHVNGYPTGKLRSGNGQWDTWSSTNIPTTHLRFPVEQANGAVQPAINEIAIDVDLLQCEATTWAVEVDWGAISVRPTLNYGIFFVHGWTGNDTTFRHFYDLAVEGGYPTYLPKNYGDGILTITDTVPLLREEIITATTAYTDVNKVLVVAYSRGGIFTRAALRQYPELASKVAGYITLSTPHHGSDVADDWLSDERIPIASQWWLNQCKKVLDAEACKATARSLRIEELRRFNYGEQCREEWIWWRLGRGWVDCKPQWNRAEAAHAFAVVGSGLFEVDGLSATLPWRADKIPFPDTSNVSRTFPVDHMGIPGDDDVFEYIIRLFDSWKDSGFDQAAAASAQIDSPDAQSIMPSITGTLTAGQVQSLTMPMGAVTTAGFMVMSDSPLTVTLLTPTGQIIDPGTPAVDPSINYDAQGDATFWYYRYRVETPADGLWQIRIEAAAITEFEAFAVGASPLLVHIFRDQGIYRPGETITLETSVLEEPGTLHTGFAFTATVQLPDGGAFTLTFHDDGVQGDKAAGDGIYAAQFTAPATNADLVNLHT